VSVPDDPPASTGAKPEANADTAREVKTHTKTDERLRRNDPMVTALWLGPAPPVRSIRWLDGALRIAARFPGATAIAAGHPSWLDLAADRASRASVQSIGVPTDLELDYLGWAQVVAGVVRKLSATIILVDEASRPERFAEIAAIAELIDAAQLTQVVAIALDERSETMSGGDPAGSAGGAGGKGPRGIDDTTILASRAAGQLLQTVRIHGPAVIGLRIAGPPVDEYPTPMPSAAMRRFDLAGLGLDPAVLAHRSLPPRSSQQPLRTVDRVADHVAVHIPPRKGS
jgi:hypothetical protein